MQKKKGKRKNREKQIKDNVIEYDDQAGILCKLCTKELPIQFYKNEDLIKRMPDRMMSPFLQSMKQDLFKKAPYLKYLRISSKFIRPCLCKSPVHTYCITAQVIRSGKVICPKCQGQYKIFVKEEQVCSRQLITLIGKYLLMIFVAIAFFAVIITIDSFAKFNYLADHPLESEQISGHTIFMGIDSLPLYNQQSSFNVLYSVRWGALFPLTVVITLVITWLLYFTLNEDITTRKKIIYTEIRPKDEDISRQQSKINLNLLIEANKRKKNNSYLFDKVWYEKRDEIGHKNAQEGFVFDF